MARKPAEPAVAEGAEALAEREARLRVEKLVLEQEKLKLETQTLGRVASRQGLWLEWLKAASVPVAVLSVFVTAIIGSVQLSQAAQARANERLDKAVTRLLAASAGERQTGVASLRLLLSERPEGFLFWQDPIALERRSTALHYMMIALASETDTRVQADIIAGLRALEVREAGQVAMDRGLQTAIEQSRSLAPTIRAAYIRQWREEARQEHIASSAPRTSTTADDAVADAGEASRDEQIEQLRITSDSTEAATRNRPALGISQAIAILTRQGAKATNYDGILCEGCDFSGITFGRGASFKGASLARAVFAKATLVGANFEDADLGGTSFIRADLTDAILTRTAAYPEAFVALQARRSAVVLYSPTPEFECATLHGADLGGQPLLRIGFSVLGDKGGAMIGTEAPAMAMAKIDPRTRLDRLGYVAQFSMSDSLRARLKLSDRKLHAAFVERWQFGLPGASTDAITARSTIFNRATTRTVAFGVVTAEDIPDLPDWQRAVFENFVLQSRLTGTDFGKSEFGGALKLLPNVGIRRSPPTEIKSCDALEKPPRRWSGRFGATVFSFEE